MNYRWTGDKICMVSYHMAVFPMFPRSLNQIYLFSNPITLSLNTFLSLIPPFFLLVPQARNLRYLWLFPSIHTYFRLGNTTILHNGLSVLYFSLSGLTYHIIPSSRVLAFCALLGSSLPISKPPRKTFCFHTRTRYGGSPPAILHFSKHQLGVL